MAKVFITGASGFVGRYIYREFRELGYEVVGTTTSSDHSELVYCDITDVEAVSSLILDCNPDIVVHSAALSSVTYGVPVEYYRINALGTENVLKGMAALEGRRRFFLLSTAGVYGNQGVEVLHEALCPKPVSHYGCSKLVAERLAANEFGNHDITILRLFNFIGVGQDASFIVPKLTHHFKNRLPKIELGNIEAERDYLPVDVVPRVIERLLSNPASYGEVINVAAGVGTSVRMLLDIMQEITGHTIEVVTAPQFIRPNEIWRLVGSTEKFNRILGQSLDLPPLRENIVKILGS